MLLSVECGQQLRGGNEALNDYIKPEFMMIVKKKIRQSINSSFRSNGMTYFSCEQLRFRLRLLTSFLYFNVFSIML